MAAGDSAAREAARQALTAQEHARLAGVATQLARNFAAAASSERRLARTLIELEPLGYTLLADRLWPGSTRSNVDLVLVGPGGVMIIDAKSWREVAVAGGRVLRDQADVTDEIARIADLAYLARQELAELGLPAGEVSAIAAFTQQPQIRERVFGVELLGERATVLRIARAGHRLTPEQVGRVRDALERLFPPLVTGPVGIIDLSVREPVLPVEIPGPGPEAPAAAAPADRLDGAELLDSAELLEALLEAARAEPIERWMTFLHPDQARIVRRSFSGPSRIRGGPGTGKTVVALHRAAHLARESEGRVLVTTYVRTLPRVLATLSARLAPDVAERIEFRSVHSFAFELLRERGRHPRVDGAAADQLFHELWAARPGDSRLARIDSAPRYWREEVSAVLKGRGLSRFEDYAGLARVGRRRPLGPEQRREMWELYRAYESGLRARGIADFDDLVLDAEASLRAHPLERYAHVIVDEAQDLSCAMLRMLHGLVGDRPDGLHLVGDGRQAIYPGGYTLPEAGISVRGRAVVLTENYRNTAQILATAEQLALDAEAPDLDGGALAEAPTRAGRDGADPVLARFSDARSHDAALVAELQARLDAGVRPGDIGVLALTGSGARHAQGLLQSAGIGTLSLDDYDGTESAAVKVGTIKRAKGLEFAEVLVARADPELFAAIPPDRSGRPVEEGELELHTLRRRELYVAMTRARDRLWIGAAAW